MLRLVRPPRLCRSITPRPGDWTSNPEGRQPEHGGALAFTASVGVVCQCAQVPGRLAQPEKALLLASRRSPRMPPGRREISVLAGVSGHGHGPMLTRSASEFRVFPARVPLLAWATLALRINHPVVAIRFIQQERRRRESGAGIMKAISSARSTREEVLRPLAAPTTTLTGAEDRLCPAARTPHVQAPSDQKIVPA